MYSTVALDSRGVVTGAFRAGPPSSGYQQTHKQSDSGIQKLLKRNRGDGGSKRKQNTKKSADGFVF